MMLKLGFYKDWMTHIMRCVASISYLMGINGFHNSSFVPSRGLRQGDPLSPYLFLLCAKGLFACLVADKKTNKITRVRIDRGSMSINHLFLQMIVSSLGRLQKKEQNICTR